MSIIPQTSCSYRVWDDLKLKNVPQQYVSIDLKGEKDCQHNVDNNEIFDGFLTKGYDFKFELENKITNWKKYSYDFNDK